MKCDSHSLAVSTSAGVAVFLPAVATMLLTFLPISHIVFALQPRGKCTIFELLDRIYLDSVVKAEQPTAGWYHGSIYQFLQDLPIQGIWVTDLRSNIGW
jgi:hypothetical protein